MKTLFSIGMLFFLGVTSCVHFSTGKFVSPSGDVVREHRAVEGFSKVDASGGIQLILTQGDTESLDIEARENLLQYIETNVENGTLCIKRKNGINFIGNPKLIAYLSVRTINALSASGGTKVELVNTVSADHLSINGSGGCSIVGEVECSDALDARLNGGGKMNIRVTADKVDVRMSGGGHGIMTVDCRTMKTSTSGGGKLELTGSAYEYGMSSSGGGRVNGFDFTTKHFSANMSGGGSAEITATETIEVAASGGGRVKYRGDAVAQKVSLSGGGSLKKIQ